MKLRSFRTEDTEAVIALWRRCGLVHPQNDPQKDVLRKCRVRPDLFIVGESDGRIVASVMVGYEGHRGWINYSGCVWQINQPIAYALRVKREKALDRRWPRRHGPLARLRFGRLGRAPFLAHAGLVYLPDTPLAVSPDEQRKGHGRALMAEAERLLRAEGCPKINLQVRTSNAEVLAFYKAIGYAQDAVVSLGKRLEYD